MNLGVAAHITAAAPGGPRYDGVITQAQRESAQNGIWLCQTCSSLIDKNGGADYSTTALHEWKDRAEAQAAQSIGKTASLPLSSINARVEVTGLGEVTGVEITKPTRIEAGTHITVNGFGKIIGIRN